MSYSRWETNDEIKDNLNLVSYNGKEINKSGIPMLYEGKNIYLDTRGVNSIVIGSNAKNLLLSPLII